MNIEPQAGIAELRRKVTEDAEQGVKWMPWISGKVSYRVEAAIRRAYREGHLTKPVYELNDKELFYCRQIGAKALLEIREALKK